MKYKNACDKLFSHQNLYNIFIFCCSFRFALLLVNQFASSVDAYTMVFLLSMELTSSSHTSLAGNLVLVGFTVGEVVVTVFAKLALDWLRLKWIITGYYTLILLYIYFVPESPYWLLSARKHDQLETWLKRIAVMNNREKDEWYPYYMELIRQPSACRGSAKHTLHGKKDKILRFLPRMSISGFMGFVTMLLYIKISYGLGAMEKTVSPYWNITIGAVVESIGYIGGSILITTSLGRKYSLVIYSLLTSLCVLTIPFTEIPLPILTIVIAQIGKMAISGAVLVTWVYVPELFPTSLRGLGHGMFVFIGRYGAIAAPIVDVLLADGYSAITFYISAGLTIVLIGFILFLPETRNRSFHTDDDEEAGKTVDTTETVNENITENHRTETCTNEQS